MGDSNGSDFTGLGSVTPDLLSKMAMCSADNVPDTGKTLFLGKVLTSRLHTTHTRIIN